MYLINSGQEHFCYTSVKSFVALANGQSCLKTSIFSLSLRPWFRILSQNIQNVNTCQKIIHDLTLSTKC